MTDLNEQNKGLPAIPRNLSTDQCSYNPPTQPSQSSQPCVKRTIVDCTFFYEDLPGVPPDKCPPSPTLPAECITGGPPPPPPFPLPELAKLELHDQKCYPASEHKYVYNNFREGFVEQYCGKDWKSDEMDIDSKRKEFGFDSYGTQIYISVSWIKDCQTSDKTQRVRSPLKDDPDVTCESLLNDNYFKCKYPGTCGRIANDIQAITVQPVGIGMLDA